MLVGGVPTRCPDQVSRPGVPTRCPDQVSPPGAPTRSGANFFCTTYFFFENQSMVDFQIRNQSSGAILMKMAVFFIENAFCVGLFQSFYDGGDLDENGRFLYLKCVLRWTFSIIL